MSIEVKVWSDYVCPFCLLAEGPVHEAVKSLNVHVEWMPFELRPHPTPTLRPEGDYLQSVWERMVYPLARRMGVQIRLPSISPQPYTRLAFEGYQFAKEHGLASEYNRRILRAFFQDERDIGQLDVLTELAEELGLPADQFNAALVAGLYADTHRNAIATARTHAINVVPTIVVDGVDRLEGVPDPMVLRRAIQQAAARRGGVPSFDRTAEKNACGIDGC